MCAPRRTMAPGTTRAPPWPKAGAAAPPKRTGTLSKAAATPPSITRLPLMRKYSSTAFLIHALTFQPPCPSGSATRCSPVSSRSSTWSTAGRRCVSISVWTSSLRRSKASSIRVSSVCICMGYFGPWCMSDVPQQGFAQDVPAVGRQRFVVTVSQLEKVFDALAEGGDPRIMHANLGFGQGLRHRGKQSRAVGAHEGQLRAFAHVGKFHSRRHLEMQQVARQPTLGKLRHAVVAERLAHARAQSL